MTRLDLFQKSKNDVKSDQTRRNMSETELPMEHKERIAVYVYFSSIYFISIGVFYLWGYWATFKINILEYISLPDVLKITVYPIASSFVFFALGLVVGEVLSFFQSSRQDTSTEDPTVLFIRKNKIIIFVVYLVITLALLFFGPKAKWSVLPMLLGLPIYVVAKNGGVLGNLLRNEKSRSTVLLLLSVLPFWAYGHGVIKADSLLNNREYQYLSAGAIDGLEVKNTDDHKQRIKYLGHANEYVFFLTSDNSTVVVVLFEKIKGLHLKQFKASDK